MNQSNRIIKVLAEYCWDNGGEMITLNNFLKIRSQVELVHRILIISLVLVIWSTFFKVIDNGNGEQFNMYATVSGLFGPSLFLVVSIIELGAVFTKNEKVFIPLRVVNTLWLFNLLNNISTIVANDQSTTNRSNKLRTFAEITAGLFTGWSPSITKIRSFNLLGGYSVIRFILFFSILVFLGYLFLRFVKKQELEMGIAQNFLTIQDVLVAFNRDKLITVGTLLLLISPFFKFIALQNSPIGRVPAFATNYIFATAIVVLAGLLLLSFARGNDKAFAYYSIAIALTFIRLNPFYVFQNGELNIGYFLYLAGLGILIYYYLTKNVIKQ